MSRKLYDIADDVRKVLESVDTETGEISESAAASLDALAGEFTGKIENIARYVRELQAEAETFRNESDDMAKKARARINKADWLKSYALNAMQATGQNKIVGELLTVAIQKSPPTVGILSEQSIPQNFWKPQPPVLDKTALLESLKTGTEIPGAELRQGVHVRIR